MSRVLVTGIGGTAGRNVAHAATLAGHAVFGVDSDPNAYVPPSVQLALTTLPSSSSDPDGFVDAVLEAANQWRINAILPQPDPDVSAMVSRRAADRTTLLPGLSTYLACSDKYHTATALWQGNASAPAGTLAAHGADVFHALVQISPRLWMRARRGAGTRAALEVRTPEEAEAWETVCRRRWGITWHDFVLQEYLPGPEYAWQGIYNAAGELVVSFARERVAHLFAHLSAAGTSSTPSRARIVDSALVHDTAVDAMNALHKATGTLHGVFGVDMRCRADGTPVVTEVNAGRFFTTTGAWAPAGNLVGVLVDLITRGEALDVPTLPPGLVMQRGADMTPVLTMGGCT